MDWLGVLLDPTANETHAPLMSRPENRIAVHVVATDEEPMVAWYTLALLRSTARVDRFAEASHDIPMLLELLT